MKKIASLTSAVLAIAMGLFVGGCAQTNDPAPTQPAATDRGTLVRVQYDFVHGSAYGADFHVDANPAEIAYAKYFDEDANDYVEIQHQAYEAQTGGITWEQINDSLMAIKDLLEEAPTSNTAESNTTPREPALDQGSLSFILTWEDASGKQTASHFYQPSDRRFSTTLSLLKEACNPTGREITYYGQPKLTAVHVHSGDVFSDQPDAFSYQCTPTGDEGEWYLFAYYRQDGKSVSKTLKVNVNVWEQVYSACMEQHLEDAPSAPSYEKSTGSLNYDDGTGRLVSLSTSQLTTMRDFFHQLVVNL